MNEYADVESQFGYGLEKIDPNRKIEVSLKDFLYLHNVIYEYISFFHQPLHHQSLEDVKKFMGNKDDGALHLLWEIAYKRFYYSDVFPEDIVKMIDDSEFENPKSPYYFKE